MSEEHECQFPEEQEPSGRLILAPCLECGLSAMDAMKELQSNNTALREKMNKCLEITTEADETIKSLKSKLSTLEAENVRLNKLAESYRKEMQESQDNWQGLHRN